MRNIRKSFTAAAIVALISVLASSAAIAAARPRIAEVSVGGAEANWTPLSTDYDHLVLTVAGPDSYATSEFPAGTRPAFALFDEAGFALPDGLYKWELTLVPTIDAKRQGVSAEARSSAALRHADGGSRQSGFLSIAGGAFVAPDAEEPDPIAAPAGGAGIQVPGDPQGVVITSADGVIRNSLCVGFDCPNSPTFSDSTILLMENNTRIKFGDTSSTSSFPNRDWEIEANSNLNGGANYLGFNDCGTTDNDGGCTTDLVFAVEAGARSSALYVESDGDVGIGTSNPVVEIHAVRGDTPTLRLEQDGSSGFQPQTWDVAGNETSFFIRDATNGSLLPFRIRPGAPTSSIFVDSDGDVGIGSGSPDAVLDLERTSAGDKDVLRISNNGRGNFLFRNTASTGAEDTWTVSHANNGVFAIDAGGGNTELRLQQSGNLLIEGSLTANASTTGDVFPDYVFEPDYELMPLEDLEEFIAKEKHLPNVMSSEEVDGGRSVNMTRLQIQILEKVEELTLYTLSQQRTINELRARVAELEPSAPSLE